MQSKCTKSFKLSYVPKMTAMSVPAEPTQQITMTAILVPWVPVRCFATGESLLKQTQ